MPLPRRKSILPAIALGAALVAPLACSPDAASPTAPPTAAAGGYLKAGDLAFDADGDGKLDGDEKKAKAEAKKAEKAVFEQMKDDWRAYKAAVKAGLVEPEFVRCEPQPSATASHTFGPKGGELKIGPHKLIIPAGALSANVTITGTATTGSRRELEFEPHGLQFNSPVQLVMNYDKCIVPDDGDLQVVYTLPGNRIVESHPTVADDDLKEVEAWTDHFSGYVVAYGRTTSR